MKATRRKKLVVLGASIVSSLLLLEAGARFLLFGPKALLPRYGDSVAPIRNSGLLRESENAAILYELEPNLRTIYKLVPFETNSRGLRDVEVPLAKPAGVFRVAVLGDSFTMPSGVALEDAYHSVLERAYGRETPEVRHEWINFAVGGYSLEQSLATLEARALAFEPDHILVGLCLANDLQKTDHTPGEAGPYRVEDRTHPYLSCWTWDWIQRQLDPVGNRAREPRDPPQQYDGAELARLLGRFAEVARREGIGLSFVALRRATAEGQVAFQLFRETLGALHVPLIDTGTQFSNRRVPAARHSIYRSDAHPNAEAHALFAEAILAALRFDAASMALTVR